MFCGSRGANPQTDSLMDAVFQPNRICNSCGHRSHHKHRSRLGQNEFEENVCFIYLYINWASFYMLAPLQQNYLQGTRVNMTQQDETRFLEIFTPWLRVVRILRFSPNTH